MERAYEKVLGSEQECVKWRQWWGRWASGKQVGGSGGRRAGSWAGRERHPSRKLTSSLWLQVERWTPALCCGYINEETTRILSLSGCFQSSRRSRHKIIIIIGRGFEENTNNGDRESIRTLSLGPSEAVLFKLTPEGWRHLLNEGARGEGQRLSRQRKQHVRTLRREKACFTMKDKLGRVSHNTTTHSPFGIPLWHLALPRTSCASL